eukprot:1652111-Pyramimonas_sp.AAC.2
MVLSPHVRPVSGAIGVPQLQHRCGPQSVQRLRASTSKALSHHRDDKRRVHPVTLLTSVEESDTSSTVEPDFHMVCGYGRRNLVLSVFGGGLAAVTHIPAHLLNSGAQLSLNSVSYSPALLMMLPQGVASVEAAETAVFTEFKTYPEFTTTPSGLQFRDVRIGEGTSAERGKKVPGVQVVVDWAGYTIHLGRIIEAKLLTKGGAFGGDEGNLL